MGFLAPLHEIMETDLIKEIRSEILTTSGVKISADDPILLNAIVIEKLLESYQKKAEDLTDEVICKSLSSLESSLNNYAERMEKMNESYVSNTKKFMTVFDKTVQSFQEKESNKLDTIVQSITAQSKAPYITMIIICSLISLVVGYGIATLL